MAAPVISHLICSIALIALILILPAFFAIERDNVAEELTIRELTEISDYTSNTLENLFLLANSTNTKELDITKELIYLPLTVEGSPYVLRISSVNGSAVQVTAYLEGKSQVAGTSWLVPGVKTSGSSLLVRNYTVVAGCTRNATGFYAWIGESD